MSFDFSSTEFWEFVSVIGGAAVIVGVIGEGFEVLNKSLKKQGFRKCIHRNDLRILDGWMEKLHPHLDTIEGWFFILLVIGLAVELFGSAKAMLLSEAENRTLRSQVSALSSSNLVLQTQLEELRKENLKLYQQIQPRRIAPEQRQAIISRLRPLPLKCDVVVVANEFDPEARQFAEEIAGVLQQCGFNARLSTGFFGDNSGTPVRTGLHFVTGKEVSGAVFAVLRAFVEVGITNIQTTSNPGLSVTNYLDIWVNAKPSSFPNTIQFTNGVPVSPAGPQP